MIAHDIIGIKKGQEVDLDLLLKDTYVKALPSWELSVGSIQTEGASFI